MTIKDYGLSCSTVTPGSSSKTIVSGGSYVSSDVVVNGDGDLAAGNIKSGVNIFGVEGTCKPRKWKIFKNTEILMIL